MENVDQFAEQQTNLQPLHGTTSTKEVEKGLLASTMQSVHYDKTL